MAAKQLVVLDLAGHKGVRFRMDVFLAARARHHRDALDERIRIAV